MLIPTSDTVCLGSGRTTSYLCCFPSTRLHVETVRMSVSTVSVWVLKHFDFPYTSVVCHSSDVTIMVEMIMVDSINYKGIRK